MRLVIISDVHSNLVAFETVVEDVKRLRPDAIVYLGDAVMKGPKPQECIDLLRSLDPLVVVRGNYDNMFTRFPKPGWQPQNAKERLILEDFSYHQARLRSDDQAWLAHLPTSETLTLSDLRIDLFHAAPTSLHKITWPWASNEELLELFPHPDTNIVLFGHIHHGFIRHVQGHLIVNSGSIGLPFDGDHRSSYAVVDIEKGSLSAQLRRVPYDIERAIQIAYDCNMPGANLYESSLREAVYPRYDSLALPAGDI